MHKNTVKPYSKGKFISNNKEDSKEEQNLKFEILKLKDKLDYEFATTGEVDDIDYQRYCKLIGLKKISHN